MSTNQPIINEITHSVETTPTVEKRHKVYSSSIHSTIVSKYVAGERIAHIARSLGVTRATVYRHVQAEGAIAKGTLEVIHAMIPEAIQTVRKAITAGDARVAMQFLERTQALDTKGHRTTSDNSLTVAINTLITPVNTSTTVSNSTPSTQRTHPSGHEGGGDDLSLSSRGQNLPKLGPPAKNFTDLSEKEGVFEAEEGK